MADEAGSRILRALRVPQSRALRRPFLLEPAPFAKGLLLRLHASIPTEPGFHRLRSQKFHSDCVERSRTRRDSACGNKHSREFRRARTQ